MKLLFLLSFLVGWRVGPTVEVDMRIKGVSDEEDKNETFCVMNEDL